MLKMLVLISGFLSFTAQAQSNSQTICQWDNFRDGIQFGSISNRHQISNVEDCANAMGDHMLHWEPIRGETMFDGKVILKKSDGEIIGQCLTKTVRPISEKERRSLPYFVTVESAPLG